MPTLRDAIATFDGAAAAGRIVNRKTRRPGPFPKSRRDPLLSNVRAALRHALQAAHGDRCISDEALEATELAPFLPALPDHAFFAAEAEKRGDPGKERSNVRLFVSVVTGRDVTVPRAATRTEDALPGWVRLYDALQADAAATGKRRNYGAALLRFQNLALANGVACPEELPDSLDVIRAWADRVGRGKKETYYELNAYRRAADLVGDDTLPRLWVVIDEDGQGIRSLPDYPARLRSAGVTAPPLEVDTVTLVTALAPRLGAALKAVIAKGRSQGLSPAWERTMADTASWAAASLVRLLKHHPDAAVSLATVTWYDLWVRRVRVAVATDVEQDAQLAELLGDAAGPGGQEDQVLIRRIVDMSARRSYENSPLVLVDSAHEEDEVPVYTQKMQQHLENCYVIAHRYFGEALANRAPEKWVPVRVAYEELCTHAERYNATRYLRGRKAKGRLLVTYPQVVCMGLPYLRGRVVRARRAMEERRATPGGLETRDAQKVVEDYHEALREYVVQALIIDDGLRVKNYTGAVAGVHVVIDPVRGSDGLWRGIRSVRTRFAGLDDHSVSLKIGTTKDLAERTRERPLSPGVVDFELLFEYWMLTRPRALVKAGLLPSVGAFDPDQDGFAVFVCPKPTGGQRQDARWKGNLTEDTLSNLFGRGLHRIAVEVLGRTLPAFDDPELTVEYRALWAGHVSRLILGSYLGGLRGDWTEACYLTNDSEATLRKNYVALADWYRERLHVAGPENPRHFDAVVDRILERRPDDRWAAFWDGFDPDRPTVALPLLDEVPPARGRRLRVPRAA